MRVLSRSARRVAGARAARRAGEPVTALEPPWGHAPIVRERIAAFHRIQGAPEPEAVEAGAPPEVLHVVTIRGGAASTGQGELRVQSSRGPVGQLRGGVRALLGRGDIFIGLSVAGVQRLEHEISALRRALVADVTARAAKRKDEK